MTCKMTTSLTAIMRRHRSRTAARLRSVCKAHQPSTTGKAIALLFILAFAVSGVSNASARPHTDQDQNAHHPDPAMPAPGVVGRDIHMEGHIAYLRAQLGINDAQLPQWIAFADALRAQEATMQTLHEQMTQAAAPKSWPDRLAREEQILTARLASVKAIEGPARALFAVLSSEQRKKPHDLMGNSGGGM
jgi:hypothetical protein